jgi:hypothetical protein
VTETEKTRRQIILDAVTDLVADFLYYDRKEDEDLPVGEIELAIEEGDITAVEIVEHFRAEFEDAIAEKETDQP